ncbi:hypothetical protein PoB_000638900 [Plakobranchus ocellatus]|uniref:Uncharacterized protein n=1 Tax=Plakobranchus ocellatus TaxID=259542 RepID=A0AAV3YCU2_9GAST|nr:hypothetical protein PoB_000638900 [Plakobranchus ocellatus]
MATLLPALKLQRRNFESSKAEFYWRKSSDVTNFPTGNAQEMKKFMAIVISSKRRCSTQGDLRLSGPPSGQGASSGARTRDRRVPADLRADSQATVLPTPPDLQGCTAMFILFFDELDACLCTEPNHFNCTTDSVGILSVRGQSSNLPQSNSPLRGLKVRDLVLNVKKHIITINIEVKRLELTI